MLNIIHLDGSPYENGLKYGKLMKNTIDNISRLNMESVIHLTFKRGNPGNTQKTIEEYFKSCIPITKEYLPDLVKETEGIADGAGKTFEEIFYLNAFLDMFDFTFPDLKKDLFVGGCTCFGIRDLETGVGYIAQNYDVRNLFAPGLTLLDYKPLEGPRALIATIAGIVGCLGLNEFGLGVVINNLTPFDSRPGVPHNYVVRHILAQKNIGDAIDAIASLKRASGYNYILADKNGEIIGMETSATSYSIYLPENGKYLCHSNHYVTAPLIEMERTPSFNGDSIVRYSRARNLLYKLSMNRRDPVSGLKLIMQDHVNYPHSICRHVVPHGGDREEFQGETVFSVVLDLNNLVMHFCGGNPCLKNYKKVRLGGN